MLTELQDFKVCEFPYFAWDRPLKFVSPHVKIDQTRQITSRLMMRNSHDRARTMLDSGMHLPNLSRNSPGKKILIDLQIFQPHHSSNFSWNTSIHVGIPSIALDHIDKVSYLVSISDG